MKSDRVSIVVMKCIFSALLLCFAAGCSNTNRYGVACPAIAVAEYLVYPVRGSTDIPDAAATIIVGNFRKPWTSLTLTPTLGLPVVSTQIVGLPNPVPNPHASFVPTSATAFHIPRLASKSTYTVDASYSQTGFCPIVFAPAGSFTTK